MAPSTAELLAALPHEEPPSPARLADDRLAEYSRVNNSFEGRATKYGYAIGGDPDSTALLKYDLQKSRVQWHDFGKGRIASETVFAPRPGSTLEDDGWLVTYVFNRGTEKSECVILDARDVTRPPTARVTLLQRVP
jgi:carotenoid cleavage dioxygenase-like enzyme